MIWEAVAAALLGLGIIWLVLQPLIRPSAPRAAIYVPPDPEETRRGVALAALKELEFDHRTGKISDEDYRAQVGPLRRRAAEALRALDGGEQAGHERVADRGQRVP